MTNIRNQILCRELCNTRFSNYNKILILCLLTIITMVTKLKIYDIDPQAATDKQVPAYDVGSGKVTWQDQIWTGWITDPTYRTINKSVTCTWNETQYSTSDFTTYWWLLIICDDMGTTWANALQQCNDNINFVDVVVMTSTDWSWWNSYISLLVNAWMYFRLRKTKTNVNHPSTATMVWIQDFI